MDKLNTMSDLFQKGDYVWLDLPMENSRDYKRIMFSGGNWVVLLFKRYGRQPQELIRTKVEKEAINVFREGLVNFNNE